MSEREEKRVEIERKKQERKLCFLGIYNLIGRESVNDFKKHSNNNDYIMVALIYHLSTADKWPFKEYIQKVITEYLLFVKCCVKPKKYWDEEDNIPSSRSIREVMQQSKDINIVIEMIV